MPQTQISRREANRTDFSLGSNTREQVKKLRISNLFMSMSAIARVIGISRQRVFQILQEEGSPTKHLV